MSSLYFGIADCPQNFTYVPSVNGCYYFVRDKMIQSAANKLCISLHPKSHLIIINNNAEQTAVTDWLHENTGEYWH